MISGSPGPVAISTVTIRLMPTRSSPPRAFSSEADATARWAQLTVLSLAELGALSLWFSASAVLPALTREWALGDGGRAGLTLAVQLGFIAGTLVSAITNLPDI